MIDRFVELLYIEETNEKNTKLENNIYLYKKKFIYEEFKTICDEYPKLLISLLENKKEEIKTKRIQDRTKYMQENYKMEE